MIRTIMIAWLILECIAYAVFFNCFSLLAGLAVGLGSTLAGLVTLRFAGRRLVTLAAERMRAGDLKPIWNSETFLILAALFLLLPGLLTDFAGLLFLVAAGLWPRAKTQVQTPRDIDLSKDDWKRLPDDPLN